MGFTAWPQFREFDTLSPPQEALKLLHLLDFLSTTLHSLYFPTFHLPASQTTTPTTTSINHPRTIKMATDMDSVKYLHLVLTHGGTPTVSLSVLSH